VYLNNCGRVVVNKLLEPLESDKTFYLPFNAGKLLLFKKGRVTLLDTKLGPRSESPFLHHDFFCTSVPTCQPKPHNQQQLLLLLFVRDFPTFVRECILARDLYRGGCH
jgi:hypothetical protein